MIEITHHASWCSEYNDSPEQCLRRSVKGVRRFKVSGQELKVVPSSCFGLRYPATEMQNAVYILKVATGIRLLYRKDVLYAVKKCGRKLPDDWGREENAAYWSPWTSYYYLKDLLRKGIIGPPRKCNRCGVRMRKERRGGNPEPVWDHDENHESTYFIQAERGGLIKIGMTAGNVDFRVKNIQANCPVQLQCLASLPQNYESRFHEFFSPHRKYGEWFEPCSQLLKLISIIQKSSQKESCKAALDFCLSRTCCD